MDRLGVQAFRHLCELRGKFGKDSLHVKILSRWRVANSLPRAGDIPLTSA
jgi:hypothetical protein